MMEMLPDPEMDEYGLLENPDDWSPELAQELAGVPESDRSPSVTGNFSCHCASITRSFMPRRHRTRSAMTCICLTAAATSCLAIVCPPGVLQGYRTPVKKRNPI